MRPVLLVTRREGYFEIGIKLLNLRVLGNYLCKFGPDQFGVLRERVCEQGMG